MSTACECPQGGGGPAHVDRGEGGRKPDFFVEVINGWPRMTRSGVCHWNFLLWSWFRFRSKL